MNRNRIITACSMLLCLAAGFAQAQNHEHEAKIPTLVVTGQAEVSATPDRAVIRLGTTAQAEQAREAQSQVNEVMQEAIADVESLGIPAERISTATITLSPVYNQPGREPRRDFEPRIVAYRASNTVQVIVDDLSKVGPVIDAGVEAGANELEGLSFTLRDDTDAQSEALAQAARAARAKAVALSQAMEVRLVQVRQISERGQVVPMDVRAGRQLMMAEMAATPVAPGQVTIQASVSVEYEIAPAGDANGAE